MSGGSRVIILGAGFGGIAAATRLRTLLDPRDEVVLVDRRTDFVMGLRKTWEIVGARSLADGTRQLAALRKRGIDVRQATIEQIDPASRTVRIGGVDLRSDAVVIALGAEQAPEAVPGLVEHGLNAWDRGNAERAHAALDAFDGGRLVIGVFGVPYACPPGPFELALLAQEALRRRKRSADVVIFGPMPIALPVVGPTESAKVEALLEQAGIAFHRGRKPTGVDAGRVSFAEGPSIDFDLLLAVPPHRCPPLLVEAGLAPPGGWVGVDQRTLETAFPGVHAVGDCTAIPLANGLALPKAGVFAEAEGLIAAEWIAARLSGGDGAVAFAGEGICYAEVGAGEAIEVHGRFLTDPPSIKINGPSPALMAAKVAFEAGRLAAWFGAEADA